MTEQKKPIVRMVGFFKNRGSSLVGYNMIKYSVRTACRERTETLNQTTVRICPSPQVKFVEVFLKIVWTRVQFPPIPRVMFRILKRNFFSLVH
jgi:hypothetical protein